MKLRRTRLSVLALLAVLFALTLAVAQLAYDTSGKMLCAGAPTLQPTPATKLNGEWVFLAIAVFRSQPHYFCGQLINVFDSSA